MNPELGLRERKKAETRQALREAAFRLAREHGPDQVTVGDIAAVADVSVRTFFNYYPSKESAIVGIDPAVIERARQLLERRPDEPPLDAMYHVLLPDGGFGELGNWYLERLELVGRFPGLQPTQLMSLAELHRALVATMASRLGLAPTHLVPTLVVSMAISTFYLTLQRWDRGGRSKDFLGECEAAFRILRDGFASLAPANS